MSTQSSTKPSQYPQCCARIWNDGKGGRCTKNAVCHQDLRGGLCTQHRSLGYGDLPPGAITRNVGNNKPNERRVMGLYNDWQDGEVGVLPYKDENGFLVIQWKTPEMAARVHKEHKEGSLNLMPGDKLLYPRLAKAHSSKLQEHSREETLKADTLSNPAKQLYEEDLRRQSILDTAKNLKRIQDEDEATEALKAAVTNYHRLQMARVATAQGKPSIALSWEADDGTSYRIAIKTTPQDKLEIAVDSDGVARTPCGRAVGWRNTDGSLQIKDFVSPKIRSELCLHRSEAEIFAETTVPGNSPNHSQTSAWLAAEWPGEAEEL